MGSVNRSVATLRFFGDELDPEEISRMVGASPTSVRRKGDEWFGRTTGHRNVASIGSWLLEGDYRQPEDLEAQIFELLGQVTSDLNVWKNLSCYAPDIFCGIFMDSGNDGFLLSPKAMLALGERGIELSFDIYAAGESDLTEER